MATGAAAFTDEEGPDLAGAGFYLKLTYFSGNDENNGNSADFNILGKSLASVAPARKPL